MPAKPRRYPKEENFRRLHDDKATRRLIDAMLDMRDPVPWNERPIPDALPPLARLARRIEQEVDAGRNVRLKPETAKKVALALYTVADGPMAWEGLKSYGHRVVRYSSSDAGEVLAYCRGVDLAIGAYEAACAKLPGAGLRFGGGSSRRVRTFSPWLSLSLFSLLSRHDLGIGFAPDAVSFHVVAQCIGYRAQHQCGCY